ncbi:RING-H2 finger protein ATL2-like [Typha angustifolia]|uniref:RING-H2 finger protein ATL2-like n=1 Tax=Typha angustifolia TaxID=59011 RepID=UPI003C2F9C3B
MSSKEVVSIDVYSGPPSPPYDGPFTTQSKIIFATLMVLFGFIILTMCCYIRKLESQIRRNRAVVAARSSAGDARLDMEVLSSLPIFVYSSIAHEERLECAICTMEFEEGEQGRLLPNCYHSYHVECIDMWFSSHSTCPVCRVNVRSENDELAG